MTCPVQEVLACLGEIAFDALALRLRHWPNSLSCELFPRFVPTLSTVV